MFFYKKKYSTYALITKYFRIFLSDAMDLAFSSKINNKILRNKYRVIIDILFLDILSQKQEMQN